MTHIAAEFIIRLHPESVDSPESLTMQQAKPGLTPDSMKNQNNVISAWEATNWNGICDELSKISNPTLIKPGTDDVTMAPANSLIIAGKIPGAWLVQIKDAAHAVMVQYPDEINKILQTFLSPTPRDSWFIH